MDADENNNSQDCFAERTRELVLIKSEGLKAKKERKTWSKITSGRAITKPEVSAKIIEHVSAAAAPKQRKILKIRHSLPPLRRMVKFQSVETRRGKHLLKQKVIHRNLDPPMCSQLTTHLQGNTSYPKTLRTSLFLRKNCVVSVKCSPHMLFEIAHPLFL